MGELIKKKNRKRVGNIRHSRFEPLSMDYDGGVVSVAQVLEVSKFIGLE